MCLYCSFIVPVCYFLPAFSRFRYSLCSGFVMPVFCLHHTLIRFRYSLHSDFVTSACCPYHVLSRYIMSITFLLQIPFCISLSSRNRFCLCIMKPEASPFHNPLPSRAASGWGYYSRYPLPRPQRGRPSSGFYVAGKLSQSR